MTLEQKKQFVDELIGTVRTGIMARIDRTPEQWDGHELRKWIADKFADANYSDRMKRGPRLRDYNNEVLVRNL